MDFFDMSESPLRHAAWLLLGSELVGAISAIKLEVLMAGMILFALALLIRRKNEALAFALLALATNWKLQPFALSALLLVVHFVQYRKVSTLLVFGGTLAVVSLLPALVLPWGFFVDVNAHWMASLNEYVQAAALKSDSFHHIFQFMKNTAGLPVTEAWFGPCGLAGAAVFAVATLFAAFAWRSPAALVAAAALGSAYPSLFSPLSQSTAYILSAPLFLAIPYFQWRVTATSRVAMAAVWLAFFLISIAYSDLVPRSIRQMLWHGGAKPAGIAVLCTLLLIWISGVSVRQPSDRVMANA